MPKSKAQKTRNRRSKQAVKSRDDKQIEIKLVRRAYDSLLFKKSLPTKVRTIRTSIREFIKTYNKRVRITLQKIDLYKRFWHPNKTTQFSYQAYGGIKGFYMPSQDSLEKGVFIISEEQGLLPAELVSDFPKRIKKWFTDEPNRERAYSCWIRGSEEPPYYYLVLLKPGWAKSSIIRFPGFFRIKGQVAAKNGDRISVYVQSNDENIEVDSEIDILGFDDKNKLKLYDWVMIDCKFKQGHLVMTKYVKLN